MLKGLRRLAGGGLLLMEVRGCRVELGRIADSLERLAQHLTPRAMPPADTDLPATEISFVNDSFQAALMEITSDLTRATGQPPDDEQVMAEYHRRRQ